MAKRYSTEERRELVEAYRESGKTQGEFCKQRGVSVASLQNYLKESFVSVPVPSSPPATELEITFVDGTIVRIRG